MNYFTNCKTAEELRKEFHKQCKTLHPDNGGNADEFKAMKAEFEKRWKNIGNIFTKADGETYRSKETMSAEQFADIVEEMIHWTDCQIEVIGSWLWVSGNTFPRREALKALHFGFSKKKKAWYYHYGSYKKRNKDYYTMDEIRAKFGTEPVHTEEQLKFDFTPLQLV